MYNAKFNPLVLNALKNTSFTLVLLLAACGNTAGKAQSQQLPGQAAAPEAVIEAAQRTEAYFPLLQGKKLALVANQTTVVFNDGRAVHLADSLLAAGLELVKVFAPEHGFRGQADAGEKVQDGMDVQTGLPIVSLYGANRKPAPGHLEGIDMLVFDIQDLGVRFYTYIATLQLVMEACARDGVPIVVLDRPNPNADVVDGPVMEPEHTGFLGMTPIPLAYGMTIGEYALLINGEGWLEGGAKADLTVIPLENYDRSIPYPIPIASSPNIPNLQAARLYPSLGLFEGTQVNAGRGTDAQFQRFGAPFLDPDYFPFSYTPEPNPGAKSPKHNGVVCHGRDLSEVDPPKGVDLGWLIEAYRHRMPDAPFFNTDGFTKHAGTALLQQQIESGLEMDAIRESWRPKLEAFREIREKYLLYR